KFITMAYLVVDGQTGEVACACGGHPPPRVVGADGAVRPLAVSGLALGIEPGQRYDEVRASLDEGESVVLFTDGVIEARRNGDLLASTSTATTGTEPVTSTLPTTSTTTTTPSPRIAAGVTVGGVAVGGMTPADAYTAVRNVFERPLVLVVGKRRFQVAPESLGAVAYALKAINRATTAAPGTTVHLDVTVSRRKVVAYVA